MAPTMADFFATFVSNGDLHQVGEKAKELSGDDYWLVRNDPGHGLLAAGLGQTALVLDELSSGGDQRGQGHRAQAGPRTYNIYNVFLKL